jgi:hypothetical protein
MATTKTVNKLSDKLTKVNESFTVYRYDNGFMIEVSGKDHEDEWKTSKLMCSTEEELIALVKEAISLKLDN